jgi:ferredoxin
LSGNDGDERHFWKTIKSGGKIMAQQVVIDQEECLGCEACVEICPAVFDFDGDTGKAFVKDDANADESCVDEAIGSCPAACISKE